MNTLTPSEVTCIDYKETKEIEVESVDFITRNVPSPKGVLGSLWHPARMRRKETQWYAPPKHGRDPAPPPVMHMIFFDHDPPKDDSSPEDDDALSGGRPEIVLNRIKVSPEKDDSRHLPETFFNHATYSPKDGNGSRGTPEIDFDFTKDSPEDSQGLPEILHNPVRDASEDDKDLRCPPEILVDLAKDSSEDEHFKRLPRTRPRLKSRRPRHNLRIISDRLILSSIDEDEEYEA